MKLKITLLPPLALFLGLFISKANADQDLISLFPMENYDQAITTWFKPSDPNYDKPVLDQATQQKHFELFYQHTFGKLSPWDANYIAQVLQYPAPDDVYTAEVNTIKSFSNDGKPADQIGYGENFSPYDAHWITALSDNINLTSLQKLTFSPSNFAIATSNVAARVLPTNDVHFYSYKLAGQGYPFDNLQMSAIWVGTPLYILAETKDHAWSMVLASDFIAWVPTTAIAHVTPAFITSWRGAAQKNIAAITHEETPILNQQQDFLFSAYNGTVFPAIVTSNQLKILVPVKDAEQQAQINFAEIKDDNAAIMPLTMTPHNIANVMSTMIGRPYGWGSMYFYNDCSAETKGLFTPFGIWLPRHSSAQVTTSRMVDMSNASAADRVNYLMQNGRPFLNLIYIGGHVILYVGNYPNPNSSAHESMAMTYQDVWGLAPYPSTRRAVIGKSVLFPLLLQYPEDTTLMSLANKKYFQIAFLNDLNTNMQQVQKQSIKNLMKPDELP